ncbi:unnamed protein product [Rotaria sp. Silwood1]|nr:unnamed protein product [Rotaria sp. Silwood1]CAF3676684.1 unnamed protein product [Rotaria sp. Silwood1]CAF4652988.1 unnamed protein product [Rotaria sp. Silwood1]
MKFILVELLLLYCIFNIDIDALPINNNTSQINNSTLNLEQKVTNSKDHLDKSTSILSTSLIIPKIQIPENFNISQIEKNLKDFGIHSLKDDKHIEGLPLDRHGKVNPDFHKEIFLGNHELFEADIQRDEKKLHKKLEEIFRESDANHDERLSKDELLSHVLKNVQQHLTEAKERNSQLFLLIDTNQDGKITWSEYTILYIRFHNMTKPNSKDFFDTDSVLETTDLELRRELYKIRFRWSQSDNDGDGELNIDEFLEFRHPEVLGRSYTYMVEDTMTQMDRDEDKKISEDEFLFLPKAVGDTEGKKEWSEADKQWLTEQKREFHEMDKNKDGFLTKDELLQAYNPMNRVHIDMQINKLFSKVDDSPKDKSLSLEEIKKHADVFTDMRILDADGALHDEM